MKRLVEFARDAHAHRWDADERWARAAPGEGGCKLSLDRINLTPRRHCNILIEHSRPGSGAPRWIRHSRRSDGECTRCQDRRCATHHTQWQEKRGCFHAVVLFRGVGEELVAPRERERGEPTPIFATEVTHRTMIHMHSHHHPTRSNSYHRRCGVINYFLHQNLDLDHRLRRGHSSVDWDSASAQPKLHSS